MPRFLITETAEYIVEAEDEDEAEAIFLNSEDPNEFFVAVPERFVEPADDE
jgi:hypothetical protein